MEIALLQTSLPKWGQLVQKIFVHTTVSSKYPINTAFVYFKVCLRNGFLDYLGPIQRILMVFNSSINFGIYLIFNKKFKDTFFGLFTRKRKVWQLQMRSTQHSNIEQQQRFL